MKIQGKLDYEFTFGETKFSFSTNMTDENALISLCVTNDLILNFEAKLKDKPKKTKQDKHYLNCIKYTGYVLRQFINGAVSDVKNRKEREKIEIIEEPVKNEDNDYKA